MRPLPRSARHRLNERTARINRPGRHHGFVVIDKPAGWTSHDVVSRVRALLGERRVGHAGTLDPAATGVLPIAVGDATRVIEYLAAASKTYLAEVTFGITTDSADGDGRVTRAENASGLLADTIESALVQFEGEIEQIPPMHSAIRVGGKRLYELARAGKTVERTPRQVYISRADLISWAAPRATIEVDCSKGTYIRSLAQDLGNFLGTGAYLSNLVRTRTGCFVLDEAWTLRELCAELGSASWSDIASHSDSILMEWPALLLDEVEATNWRHGRDINSTGAASGMVRAYDNHGEWLGVGQGQLNAKESCWLPQKVVGGAA